ncbi:MAG: TlpA family protein disulfide reductase [Bernardetiaceae bacterium]|nr:TlpA family protein disulfide reductase [Bernardetiaceae bacterium]
MKTETKATLLDILTGIASAVSCFFILESFALHIAIVLFSPLPVLAGFIRGKAPADNRFLKVLLMNLLFFVLFMAILNGVFYLLVIIGIALVGTNLGIYTRLNFSTSRLKVLGFLMLFSFSVLSLGFIGLPAYFNKTLWSEVDEQAPPFTFLTPEGDVIQSSDYEGKVIVIDFWATWCAPCLEQFPIMEKLHKQNADNDDIHFFAVNSMKGGDTPEKVLKFINKGKYELPFVMDKEGTAYKSFNVRVLPHLVIIDKQGRIKFTHTGYMESENLYEKVQEKLDKLTSSSRMTLND